MSAPGQRGAEILLALAAGSLAFLPAFVTAEWARNQWWAATDLDKVHSALVAVLLTTVIAAAAGYGVGRSYAAAGSRARLAWRIAALILFLGAQGWFWSLVIH